MRLGSSRGPSPSPQPGATPVGPSLRDFAKLVLDVRDTHRTFSLAGRHRFTPGRATSASVSSSNGLGLGNDVTSATLSSTEEVNTTPTSYSTTEPTISGLSSSEVTIGGVYSGENGDTTLTFTVKNEGIIELDGARIEVRDSEGNKLEDILTGEDPAGTVYTLTNGIEVSFSSGTLIKNDTFTLDVFATVGTSVDASKAFDGTGDDAPGFEEGLSVGAGSFTVNGVAISVAADDSIDAVVNRITASAAGVTAVFDVGTESVVLTQKTAGAGSTITLGSDSSGFLAATKLGGATVVPGKDEEYATVIASVAQLAAIQSGIFTVNGVDLSLDRSVDSLQDVIDRINAADAGAVASYDEATGKVTVSGTGTGTLVLDDGDTNLFTTLEIAVGSHDGDRRAASRVFEDEPAFRKQFTEFALSLSALYGEEYSGFGAATVASIRKDFDDLIEEAFSKSLGKSGPGTLRSGLGIDFVRNANGDRELQFDVQRLEHSLRTDPQAVVDLLFSEDSAQGFDGIVIAIGERFDGILQTLETVLGPDAVGLSLDVSG